MSRAKCPNVQVRSDTQLIECACVSMSVAQREHETNISDSGKCSRTLASDACHVREHLYQTHYVLTVQLSNVGLRSAPTTPMTDWPGGSSVRRTSATTPLWASHSVSAPTTPMDITSGGLWPESASVPSMNESEQRTLGLMKALHAALR